VGTIVNGNRAEGGQFREQFLAVWRVEIVWFVGAKIVPYGDVRTNETTGMNLDGYRSLLLCKKWSQNWK